MLALSVTACMLVAYAGVNLVLEQVSRFAEVRLGAHLWWQEEYLQLFTPSNYVDRGAGRLLIYGPSEAREAFVPEVLDEHLPHLQAYQNAQSIGTIEDGLVVLDYIEQAYGPSAIPDALLLGTSTRFIADIRPVASPLYAAINKYSPYFSLDEATHPPTLVPKSLLESMQSRFAFLRHQTRRYRAAIKAVVREVATRLNPRLSTNERLLKGLRPSKYRGMRPWTTENKQRWLDTPGGFWEAVHAWDPDKDRSRIAKELGGWADFARRHGSELYVINIPEISLNRAMYKPGRYEAYISAMQDALKGVPFLNLREFLADDVYYDSCHPTREGAIILSHRVGEFVARQRRIRSINQHEQN